MSCRIHLILIAVPEVAMIMIISFMQMEKLRPGRLSNLPTVKETELEPKQSSSRVFPLNDSAFLPLCQSVTLWT